MMKNRLFIALALSCVLFASAPFSGCQTKDPPLDADSRHLADSIAAVRIGIVRRELDSLCKNQEKTEMPRLIDSLKRERLREIKESLKGLPK